MGKPSLIFGKQSLTMNLKYSVLEVGPLPASAMQIICLINRERDSAMWLFFTSLSMYSPHRMVGQFLLHKSLSVTGGRAAVVLS